MLDVPHYRQRYAWSCGSACVRMVLAYYGEEVSEQELIEELGANSKDGTRPEAIAMYLRGAGLHAIPGRMGRGSLGRSLSKRPVLVVYQDHGHRGTGYATSWDHGHYAIIVGIENKRVYLADPSSKRPRRHLKLADFLSRWHDIDASGKIYRNWGLAVGPRK